MSIIETYIEVDIEERDELLHLREEVQLIRLQVDLFTRLHIQVSLRRTLDVTDGHPGEQLG